MKDLHLSLQIRNNRLRSKRVERWMTASALCDATGICENKYSRLERMLCAPRHRPALRICRFPGCGKPANYPTNLLCREHVDANGTRDMPTKRGEETWLPEVIALAKFYECEPASLFPADVLCLEKSNFEKEMDASDLVMAIPGPSSSMSPEQLLQVEGRQKLLESTIREQLASISPREAQVLRLRFGLSESGSDQITQKEIGERLGVSQERIRQIEGQALRKLRHPSRAIPIARAAFEQYNDLGKDQP